MKKPSKKDLDRLMMNAERIKAETIRRWVMSGMRSDAGLVDQLMGIYIRALKEKGARP